MTGEDVVVVHIDGRELPDEDVVVSDLTAPSLPLRILFLVAGLGLFVTALGLMKTGAASLVPALRDSIFTDNAWSTLGVGWLGACIVLSGSPIAASALTLLDGGAIDRSQSFTMLTGSRLGAAFVVLVVGTLYALRSNDGAGRRAPISIGILSLLMTVSTYVPGAVVGYVLLERGAFDGIDIGTSPALTSTTDALFGWAVDVLAAVLPDWVLFPAGVGVLLAGFAMFDRVLPAVSEHRLEERHDAWHERKWTMFLIGCGVCLLTLSVSVALTVLVPLVAKGYIRRANTLPYIAGANITTLADTLVAAVLLGNQDAVRVAGSDDRGHGLDPLPSRPRLPGAAEGVPRCRDRGAPLAVAAGDVRDRALLDPSGADQLLAGSGACAVSSARTSTTPGTDHAAPSTTARSMG